MTNSPKTHARWIWMELIGFENTDPDFGIKRFLETTGYIPDAISILITAVDIILLHDGIRQEKILPPDVCSRHAHERNEARKRQVWTNHQLKKLIAGLHCHSIEVYVSVFPSYLENEHHREWLGDHLELLEVWDFHGKGRHVNPLLRFKDGAYFEDLFVKRLVETLNDYGFDGWHACDGWGPLGGALYNTDCADDMIRQFSEFCSIELPDFFNEPYEGTPARFKDGDTEENIKKLQKKTRWIWGHKRREWIDFYTQRWATFWEKVIAGLHQEGKKAVINSSWARDPFESIYRYGIDYKKIAETGVDGIVVETVAANIGLRRGDTDRHYDFLAMLALIKAAVPNTKLIFLHGLRDVLEEYDLLRHNPVALEKEVYSLANVFHINARGQLLRSASGFLCCLGDGIKREEWAWLVEKWNQAFSEMPARTIGPTIVWSDHALYRQVDDFIKTRRWTSHRILFKLMELGVPLQTTVSTDGISGVEGPILVPNHHLFSDRELEKVFSYKKGPIIAIGCRTKYSAAASCRFEDGYGPEPLGCEVFNATEPFEVSIAKEKDEDFPSDMMTIEEPQDLWGSLRYRKVSESFLQACANSIFRCLHSIFLQGTANELVVPGTKASVGLMVMQLKSGKRRVAIVNNNPVYTRPIIDMVKPIISVNIVSKFPLMNPAVQGSKFSIKVPPKGITIVDVTLAG